MVKKLSLHLTELAEFSKQRSPGAMITALESTIADLQGRSSDDESLPTIVVTHIRGGYKAILEGGDNMPYTSDTRCHAVRSLS
jgi:hypothetical protein